jgi:hypothetical protein
MEKVLYASGQLQGAAQDWWESYEYGRPNNAPAMTWKEFREEFRAYHILEGLIELKQEEFRALKQGSMTVSFMTSLLSCHVMLLMRWLRMLISSVAFSRVYMMVFNCSLCPTPTPTLRLL